MLSKDYEIFHYSHINFSKVNLHHHDFYECYFFISGDITYLIEGKAYTLNPGDIVLVNTRELHQAVIGNSTEPYERIVLWIDKKFLQGLSSDATDLTDCFELAQKNNVIRTDFESQQIVKSILKKLLNLEDYNSVGRDILHKAYIIELAVNLNRLMFDNTIKNNVDLKKSNLIDGIIEYINSHLDEEISIDALAKHFFLSKYHLLREFKKHSGTTIHKFIIQKKLIEAKELILQEIPITSVYIQCGFGDYSNFFRAFKNEYGVTPRQYYQLMQKP